MSMGGEIENLKHRRQLNGTFCPGWRISNAAVRIPNWNVMNEELKIRTERLTMVVVALCPGQYGQEGIESVF